MNCSISSELYGELAVRLVEAVGAESYFSGCVEFVYGDVECRFVASLIIYRRRESLPEGDVFTIAKVVPVWWEFHTTEGACELVNDFDFSELATAISSIA